MAPTAPPASPPQPRTRTRTRRPASPRQAHQQPRRRSRSTPRRSGRRPPRSAATARRDGIRRVCRAWERSRSALDARRTREQTRAPGAASGRRGPTPTVSDETLLAAIRADLARSPFQGEGHRKVHARLRILDGIRVARTRVLRVMRMHGLLAPQRGRQGHAQTHDGTRSSPASRT